FTDRHQTPWGAAINFDDTGSATVRSFYIENARYWLEEYCLDGLRLDAVHAIVDDSPRPFLAEPAVTLRPSLDPSRQVHIILENEKNQASLLRRLPDGRPEIATAQWNDDIHHALHCLLTGESDGYYADFAQAPAKQLATGLAQGFIYQGQ